MAALQSLICFICMKFIIRGGDCSYLCLLGSDSSKGNYFSGDGDNYDLSDVFFSRVAVSNLYRMGSENIEIMVF